ncbi:Mitogen-activated protein kinase kinase kinase 5 [Vitis vinifera]|uniref:Mitogen-activated protein kinase kinase kinase 5 n=1 Tax=Vitis vinifera TaxID=29760 RepID=A0A438K177_VITVI|nr:Mitogen-activated protein kinase kinase kinase 5 [Vitis vinifera]
MFKVFHESPPLPETLSSEGRDFLQHCFRRNPAERPSAAMLLDHSFVRSSQDQNVSGFSQAFSGMQLVVSMNYDSLDSNCSSASE